MSTHANPVDYKSDIPQAVWERFDAVRAEIAHIQEIIRPHMARLDELHAERRELEEQTRCKRVPGCRLLDGPHVCHQK